MILWAQIKNEYQGYHPKQKVNENKAFFSEWYTDFNAVIIQFFFISCIIGFNNIL